VNKGSVLQQHVIQTSCPDDDTSVLSSINELCF